ncbi:MAG: GNAT family N-acetyltransferase [Chlorobiales bacterium]|nr:GNAT family N-acetyltransferase [Chlorobiales bacterium]
MNILDSIVETEFRYGSAMGAGIRKMSNSVRVSDDRIPERDAYNYVFVSRNTSFDEAKSIVIEELNRFRQSNAPHIKIVFHPQNQHWQRIEELEPFTYTARFIMALPLSRPANPVSDENCRVLGKSDLEALYEFEFHMYEPKGADYARRQTEIKLDTYTNKEEFEVVLYSLGKRVVGNVELYSDNGITKFDDFKVHEGFRRRGFGKKLQHFALLRAYRNGAGHLYAITDDDGFVKELYKKDGFTEVGILHTFRK